MFSTWYTELDKNALISLQQYCVSSTSEARIEPGVKDNDTDLPADLVFLLHQENMCQVEQARYKTKVEKGHKSEREWNR